MNPPPESVQERGARLRLGIRGKLFVASLVLLSVTVAVAYLLLSHKLEADIVARTRADMEVRLALVRREAEAQRLSTDDRAGWDTLADSLGTSARARVSIVRVDGALIGDSEVELAELARAENHADRPEVKAALSGQDGVAERTSHTVGRRMMYAALPLVRDGQPIGVVRLAVPLDAVDVAIAELDRAIIAGGFGALVIALAMSSLTAHWISRNVRELTQTAKRMARGDLVVRTRATNDDELGELGSALDHMAESLSVALDELSAEKNLLGNVLDGMREGVLVVNRAGVIALANPALREALLLGADVVGKAPIEAIESERLVDVLSEVRASEELVVAELELGSLKPRRLLVHASPLAALGGGAESKEDGGTLAVFVDVTELRRLESMRKDFVANVSHELRTPITLIRSATETLEGADWADDMALEFVEIIQRNAERLQRLVEDLLDLSRIESGSLKLRPEPVDLEAIINSTVTSYAERAQKRGVRFEVRVDHRLYGVRADKRALEQVLSNLIENAVKYAVERETVQIIGAVEGDRAVLRVCDRGPGIAPQHLARIFERFYRVDTGRSRELGGTGLGLSIVKHLVEAMGGEVGVDSTAGKGTTFTIRLPFTGEATKKVERA